MSATYNIVFITDTTTSTVGSANELSALIRGNNNTCNSISEATHHALMSDIQPYSCESELLCQW